VIAIHSGGRTPFQNDLLPSGEQTRGMLVQARFDDVRMEDTAERNVVAGRRFSAVDAHGELPSIDLTALLLLSTISEVNDCYNYEL
jgi:hypothetical protein